VHPVRHTAVLISLLCISLTALADEVRMDDGERVLNANLELAPGQTIEDGVILMLHGTLGHKDMEIIVLMQSVFQEYEHSSLAINLSLDIDDRHGFYPCERPHTHEYNDALAELNLWVDWLEEQNVGDIIMLGHSRGANQVANYLLQEDHSVVAAILLAPSAGSDSMTNTVQTNLARSKKQEWLDDTDFLHCQNTKVSAESYISYYASQSQGNTPELLQGITTPVLVLSGSQDSVVKGLAVKMNSVNNERVMHLQIDGADHFFRDLFAYDVADASVEFLATIQ
jgi:pimeloyl-ACP methyl ester carboxylesterase